MAAARVALTALSATLFGIISLSFPARKYRLPFHWRGQISYQRTELRRPSRPNIGEMGIRVTWPESRAQLPVGPSLGKNLPPAATSETGRIQGTLETEAAYLVDERVGAQCLNSGIIMSE